MTVATEIPTKATHEASIVILKPGTAFQANIVVFEDDDGSYSAIVENLPGANGTGDSEADAIESAKESIQGLIESYAARNLPTPWVTDIKKTSRREGATEHWVIVHA